MLTALPSHELCEGSPVTLRCQTKLHSQKSALRLLFSFHKEGRTLQNRSSRPELRIPAAKEGDAGLYWCKAPNQRPTGKPQSAAVCVQTASTPSSHSSDPSSLAPSHCPRPSFRKVTGHFRIAASTGHL